MPLSRPPARLKVQRRLAENSFADTCKILTVTTTADSYGGASKSTSEGSAKACQFIPQASFSSRAQEVVDSDGTIKRIGAVVRLSVDEYTSVTSTDQIKITKINGETLATALTFDVMGKPQLMNSYVHINLQEVSR